MARNVLRPLLPALLAVLFFSGCTVVGPHLSVLAGNFAHAQGRYQQATVRYLEVIELDEYRAAVSYNLGNVYHSLGEASAALTLWEEAEGTDDPSLLYGVRYNRGVLYYELGRYAEAYEQFSRALEIDPGSIPAKVNLELALEKVQAAVARRDARSVLDQQPEADTLRILEFVRRREQRRAQANRDPGPVDSLDDW